MSGLRVLVVDDEALARTRLRQLLAQCREPAVLLSGEAASAADALAQLQAGAWQVLLLDIHMPGISGLALAAQLRTLPAPPAVVFVTAHPEHALQAFELDAVDYLTKPVRLERLQAALQKAERTIQHSPAAAPKLDEEFIIIPERGRTFRVPLAEVLCFKAELKYLTVITAARSYIWNAAIADMEQKHPSQFIRVHRNALVARHAIRALEKRHDAQEGECWVLRLAGTDERIAVSRRQMGVVRELLGGG